MKSARSLSKMLIWGAFVAALVSSCTIETKDDDDDETGGKSAGGATGGSVTTGGSGAQTGGSASTGGDATTGGTASETGGTASQGGAGGGGDEAGGGGGQSAGAGGTAGDGAGGIGGQGGAGGAGGAGFDDCEACLNSKCQQELDACLDDPICFSESGSAPGQYEQVVLCVDGIRGSRPAKRADVRACGTQVGSNDLWPPDGMADTTRNLINCMATGVTGEDENDAWASSANLSNPWASGSCAKLACTSQSP